jgi:O-antigen biosynthesis protein
MKAKELIVVLGMHRSGTSALTRGLQALGIELGSHLMPALEGVNNKGFWEDTEVVYFNEEILDVIGNSWCSLAPITDAAFTKLREEGYVQRASEIILRKISADHIFGLKDPRITKLLPFWKEVFAACNVNARYILAVRNPLSVERSLNKRDRFIELRSYYLWLSYMLHALTDDDVQRGAVVVDYDRLIDAPAREIKRIADQFDLVIDEVSLDEYVSEFLDHGLRHSSYTGNDFEALSPCHSVFRDTYSLALSLAADSASFNDESTRNIIRQCADRGADLEFLVRDIEGLRAREDSLTAEMAGLKQRLASMEQYLSESEHARASTEQYLASVVAGLESTRSSTSWRVTAPMRYVVRNARNARTVARSVPGVLKRQGGLGTVLRTTVRVLRTEGLHGLKWRLRRAAINHAIDLQRAESSADDQCQTVAPRYLDSRYIVEQGDLERAHSIAIHVHLTGNAGVDDIAGYLANVPYRFSLYVCNSSATSDGALKSALSARIGNLDGIVVSAAKSKGRFVSLVLNHGRALLRFEYVAHIFADSTFSSDDASAARLNIEQMFGPLNSDGREVVQISNLLADGTPIVCPARASAATQIPASGIARRWLCNVTGATSLDLDAIPNLELSMFWARKESLGTILACAGASEPFSDIRSLDDDEIDRTLGLLISRCVAQTRSVPVYLCRGDSVDEQRHYEDQIDFSAAISDDMPKVLSYYLPQFHPTPENNQWHGEGFTEWTKVQAANPLFRGHYQQHIPHPDIGYYLLETPETLAKQADMMKKAGVYGQIFYHYWFGGKLILEKPVRMLLENSQIDMPYCFCWANENWTRRWDGNEREILLSQNYSAEDARAFIRYLFPFFRDSRYITVEGRPVLMVYRASSIPDCRMYIDAWRDECAKAGLPEPYVVAVLTRGATNPDDFGMHAGTERVLHDWTAGGVPNIKGSLQLYGKFDGQPIDYSDVADYYMAQREGKPFTYWRSLVATWDNTARYGKDAYVVHNFDTAKYQEWLEYLLEDAKRRLPAGNRFVLVNAWNEWAEGAHLEPDTRYGYAYLNSIGRALTGIPYAHVDAVQRASLSGVKVRVRLTQDVAEAFERHTEIAGKFVHCLSRSSLLSTAQVEVENDMLYEALKAHCPNVTRGQGEEYDRLLVVNRISYFPANALENLLCMAKAYPRSVLVSNTYGSGCEAAPTTPNGSVDRALTDTAAFVLYPAATQVSRSYKLCADAKCYVTLPDTYPELPAVTTIIRFHKSADIELLEGAILSLLAMSGCIVQPMIAAQDLSDSQKAALDEMLAQYPWHVDYAPIVTHYTSADGCGDLRSRMLNESLKAVKTRYAAFLDYDDLILPHSYRWFIDRLRNTGKAVTFGRVYAALFSDRQGRIVERRRAFEYGKSYHDFIENNHAPIHSFMMDVARLDLSGLQYFDDQKYMEDYMMTLQIFSAENSDWIALEENFYVGDYIHSLGRPHTLAIVDSGERKELLRNEEYLRCLARIDSLRGKRRSVVAGDVLRRH